MAKTTQPKKAAATTELERPAVTSGKALDDLQKADAAKTRLLELLGRITAQTTVDGICRTVVEGVRELMGFERAGLFLWDESIKTFRGTFGTSMQLKTTDEHGYTIEILPGSPEERILAGSVIERGCKLGAPEAMPGEEHVKADIMGLRAGGKLYGLMSVDNRLSRRPVSDQELQHLTLMSHVLGNAIEATRTRAALAQSEERFRQISENSREWIWEVDREGRYAYCSPGVKDILGYEQGEIVGRHLADLLTDDDRKTAGAEIRKAVAGGGALHRLVHHAVHKKGFPVALETTGMPIQDGDGKVTGFRGVHRDVTRERELESQLRHSQKIEAIGRLAGGIAHDFNNLLTAILGCGSLLLEEMRPDDPNRGDIEKIRQAGERAAALTRQLLAFSRRQVLQVQRLNVNDIVRDMEKLLRRTLGEDIELETKLAADLPPVESDADQLQQVILHLAINARDAMTDPDFLARFESRREEIDRHRARLAKRPKRLLIETASRTLDAAYCAKHLDLEAGAYVMLSILDTGIGMPKEVREHLFEPFFTTKEIGKGSGLGLSTVYGIVQQMKGHIEVDSVLGEGTTFRILLPLSGGARPEAKPGAPATLRGGETILVVEDEEVVRNLTVRMLRTLGYQTIEAAHGAEALEICRHRGEPIHLVLTDMVMPHMSGAQFVEELKGLRRDFKVLFVSGYGSEDLEAEGAGGRDMPLIQKPFTRETLAKRIREVMDGGGGGGMKDEG